MKNAFSAWLAAWMPFACAAWGPALAAAGERGAPHAVTARLEGVAPDWDRLPAYPDGFEAMPDDPHVAVDRERGAVAVAAALSQGLPSAGGPLEFLLVCGTANGAGEWLYERSYESVFTTRARPDSIFFACLLAGFEPGGVGEHIPEGLAKDNAGRIEGMEETPEETPPPAEKLILEAEWVADGQTRRTRAESFLHDRATGGTVPETHWAFTGSYMVFHPARGRALAADMTRVAVATFHDRSALVNLPFATANSYRESGAGLALRVEGLPGDFRYRETVIDGIDRRGHWLPLPRPALLFMRREGGDR